MEDVQDLIATASSTDGVERVLVSGQKEGQPRCRSHDQAHRRREEELGEKIAVLGHFAALQQTQHRSRTPSKG